MEIVVHAGNDDAFEPINSSLIHFVSRAPRYSDLIVYD